MRRSFAALFKDRLDSFIRKPETTIWRKQSKFNYFTDENLLEVIDLKWERPVAISLDRRSHLAVLSLKIEDPEERVEKQSALVKQLRAIGVEKPCSYIVNELGEINVYLCFDEEFDSVSLHPLLKNWLMHCEMELDVQVVAVGEPLELPLQREFAWTTNHCTPLIRRMDIALEPAIAMFLSNLSKGLLSLSEVMTELVEFPIILPPEPEPEPEPEPIEKDEFAGENIVSLARRREERNRRQEIELETEPEIVVEEEAEEEEEHELIVSSEDQAVFEELLDFNLSDIPVYNPAFDPKPISEATPPTSSTMLPPPGSTSFKQLTIPFFND